MTTDENTTLETLKRLVREFSSDRDWEQFHNPKDLALALVCEVGELLEHMRYRHNASIAERIATNPHRLEFAHELADCLWLLLRMADVCEIDLSSSLQEKLELAAKKYPAALVRGRPDKYTEYEQAP